MADSEYTTALVKAADMYERARKYRNAALAKAAARVYATAAALAPTGYAASNCLANAQDALEYYRMKVTSREYEQGRTVPETETVTLVGPDGQCADIVTRHTGSFQTEVDGRTVTVEVYEG